MTKTEKRLVNLCELIEAYFQMENKAVKGAIESQLKGEVRETIEEVTAKKLKPKDSMELPLQHTASVKK